MKKYILLLLIIFLSLLIRVINLPADPPIIVTKLLISSSLYCDDGMYPHNARNKLLFGQWITDDWNPFLYNPILTLIYYGGFVILGVKMAVVKIINILIGGLIILIFYLISKSALTSLLSSLITILFAGNLYFITFNKTGLLENFLMLCMILVFYFFIKSDNNIKYGLLVGVFSVLAVLSKFLFIPFIIIPTIAVILLSYQRKELKLLIYYIIGGLFTGLLWLLVIYIPNHQFFTKIGGSWSTQAFPDSIKQALHNVLNTPFSKFMALMPLVFLFACLFMGKTLIEFFQKKVNSKVVFLFLWIFILFLQIGSLNYQPLRYYMPVILACFIAMIFLIKDLMGNIKPSLIFGYISASLILLIFFRVFFKLIIKRPSIFFVFPIPLRILIWLGLVALLSLPLLKLERIRKFMLIGIISIAVITSLFLYKKYFLNPTFNLERAARRIHKLPEGSFLIGQGAPRLAFDSKLQAIPVYKGWFNDIDTFNRFPVTHIISVEKWTEHKDLENKYPEKFKEFKMINRLRYWDTNFILFELNQEKQQ